MIEEQSTTFSPNILGSKVFKDPTILDTRPFWIRVACRAGSPDDFNFFFGLFECSVNDCQGGGHLIKPDLKKCKKKLLNDDLSEK